MATALRWGLAPLLLTTSLALGPAIAHADADAEDNDQPVRLSLQPVDHPGSYFNLTLEPGETEELTIAAGNDGEEELDVRLYRADVYTIINGGFGAREHGTEPTGTTTWLEEAEQEITLDAEDKEQIALSLTVPDDTEPGQYITSLVLENAEPVEGTGDVVLDQIVRQALPVAIEVPGDFEPDFEFGDASHRHSAGRSVVDIAITNTGDTHLKPEGELTVHDDDGETLHETSVTMSDFFATTETRVETTLDEALPPGDYTVSISLTDPASDASAEATEVPFTVEEATDITPAETEQEQQPETTTTSGPGALTYILGAAVLLLLGAVIYLILQQRKTARPS